MKTKVEVKQVLVFLTGMGRMDVRTLHIQTCEREVLGDLMSRIWDAAQNIQNVSNYRSMVIGDVIMLDGEMYLVNDYNFIKSGDTDHEPCFGIRERLSDKNCPQFLRDYFGYLLDWYNN
jgi:hypothetical protein